MSDNGPQLQTGGRPARRRTLHGPGGRYLVDDDKHRDDGTGIDPARAARRARDAELVLALRAGDADAFGTLFDEWFDRVHDVVRRIVRRPDVADEVAQDAFLAAWRRLDTLDQPEAFGGWLLRIARNAALNRREREQRSSSVDDQGMAMIEAAGTVADAPAGFAVEDRLGRAATPAVAVEDAEIVDLVWEAAEALAPRDVEVLDLQLRHGLTPAEIGEMLDINRNAANQLVHRLKGRLENAIRARVVWRSGQPACTDLAATLRAKDITRFSADAVKEIERHLRRCTGCDDRQKLRLQPSALFASLPILAVSQLVRQQAATALIAHGVPLQGSAAAAAAAGAGPAGGASGPAGPSGGENAGSGAPSGGEHGAGSGGGGSASPPADAGGAHQPWGVGGDRSHVPFTSAGSPITNLAAPVPPVAPPPPPTPAAPPPPPAGPPSPVGRRRALVGAGAGAVVVLAIIALGLRPVIAGGTVETGSSAPIGSSAITLPGETTTTPTVGPSATEAPDDDTEPSVTSSRPDGQPADPTTTRPGGTTSTTRRPTTTTTLPPISAIIEVSPARVTFPFVPNERRPVLSWTVDTEVKVSVEVTNAQGAVLSTAPKGTVQLCPGRVCSSNSFTLTVTPSDGRPKVSPAPATLTVTPATTTTTGIIIR